MLAIALKFRDIGYILVIVALYAWVKTLQLAAADVKSAQDAAIKKLRDQAEALSNELVIAQAQAMAITEQKVITYVDRIRTSPDDAARNRAGSAGVRDLIRGVSTAAPERAASPAVQGPATGPRP